MKSASITIKELHARTGRHVRRAATTPLQVTDRGKLVAVLAAPRMLNQTRRQRVLLPAYAKFLKGATSHDVLQDLDAVRGER